jgi:5-methylcytosine-specific restriction endonuclease McrA
LTNIDWLDSNRYFTVTEDIFPRHILASKFHERGTIPELEIQFQRDSQVMEPIHVFTPTIPSGDKYEDIEIGNLDYPSDFHESDEENARKSAIVYRIIRDTTLSLQIKSLYNYKCQLCDQIIEAPSGQKYAECHHIKPLGKPHNGPDSADNLICLCPNCHAKLDYGMIKLEKSKIMLHVRHELNQQFIDYHNDNIYSKIM